MGARRTGAAVLLFALAWPLSLLLPGVVQAGPGLSMSVTFASPSVVVNVTTQLLFRVSVPNLDDPVTSEHYFYDGLQVATPHHASGNCDVTFVSETMIYVDAGWPTGCSASIDVVQTLPGHGQDEVYASDDYSWFDSRSALLEGFYQPTISASFASPAAILGHADTLTYTLTNLSGNPGDLTGVRFSTALPAGLTAASGSTQNCNGGQLAVAGGIINLSYAVLYPGVSCQIQVPVTGAAAGSHTVSAGTLTSDQGIGATGGSASVNVVALPGPWIHAKFDTASMPLGSTDRLGYTIDNIDGTMSRTSVSFSTTLPAGLTVDSGPSSACGGTLVASGTTVSLSGATLAPESLCPFHVTVTGTAAGSYTVTSGPISSLESGPGGTASATVAVVAHPVLSMAFSPAILAGPGTTSLTFTMTNPAGNAATLTGLAFSYTAPSGLTLGSLGGIEPCDLDASTSSSGFVVNGASIPAGSSCSFSFNVTVSSAGYYSTTTTAITSTNGGTGNAATANLAVGIAPIIGASFASSTIEVGQTDTLTYTLTNPSVDPSALTGVGFSTTLPAGLTAVDGTSSVCGSTLTIAGGTISLSGVTIARNGQCQIPVVVTGTAAGSYTVTSGNVTSNEGGPGGTASASVEVFAPPTFSADFGYASMLMGHADTLTFAVANPGGNPAALTGVSFSATLPDGLAVSSALDSVCGGTVTITGSRTITLTGATVAAGDTCYVPVAVVATAGGDYTVSSDHAGSSNGGTSGPASASVTVIALAPPTITAAFGSSSLTVGGTTTLTFTVTNPNAVTKQMVAAPNVAPAPNKMWIDPDTLNGVGFTDTLPAGLQVANPNGLTGSCGGGTISATAGGTTISLAGATIAPAASCTFSMTVLAIGAGTQQNSTGPVGSTEGGAGSAGSGGLTVVPAAATPGPTSAVTPPPTNASGPGSSGGQSAVLLVLLAGVAAAICLVWRAAVRSRR